MYDDLSGKRNLIRLVHLQPAMELEDVITCALVTMDIDKEPEYEALSYTWGDAGETESIIVCKEAFTCTKNLASALRGLRLADRERVMWIDAICINQASTLEKSQQLPLMPRIYSAASRVVVWLGIKTTAMELLRTIHRRDPHWSRQLDDVEERLFDFHGIMSLIGFFKAPWWNRVWTAQEIILAKNVEFHSDTHHTISDGEVLGLADSFRRHTSTCCRDWDKPGCSQREIDSLSFSSAMRIACENVSLVARLRQEALQSQSGRLDLPLERLAAIFQSREATDPRDKLYGLLGLAKSIPSPPINYSRSVVDCYKTMTVAMIQASNSLDVLNMICLPYGQDISREKQSLALSKTAGCPTWCPDWNVHLPTAMSLSFRYQKLYSQTYSASANTPPQIYVPQGKPRREDENSGETEPTWVLGSQLCIGGFYFDTVKVVGLAQDRPDVHGADIFRQWESLAEGCWATHPSSSSYPSGQDARLAFFDTLSAGYYTRDEDRDKQNQNAWNSMNDDSSDKDSAIERLCRWDSACSYRSFIVSEKGYFGLAPESVRVGDKICILLGGKTPYIIRANTINPEPLNHRGAGSEYQVNSAHALIGEAYVHGIMNGEGMQERIKYLGDNSMQLSFELICFE